MLSAHPWDHDQAITALSPPGGAGDRHRWQVADTGRTFAVYGSHAIPDHPMYDIYETTDGAPPVPAARLAQLHSLMRARLLIAKLVRPAFTANWAVWETALVVGEGIGLATAPVQERGTWTFTFDYALDTEHEGYRYDARGPLLEAAFQAAADFFHDNEVTDPEACEDGILGIVLASYARRCPVPGRTTGART
ncbi:hypothetical protein ACFWVF_28965 [Streptomyces sp. NPDC058659]|uniref:hypothetical protein n=1 Tax=Streptomyces sp. NPDC058659 TaxID=3346581 RepID=UPI00365939EF